MSLKLAVIPQVSESHCGPAVLQMLLAYYGVNVTQETVVAAGRVKSSIIRSGMRPLKLAQATQALTPHLLFWFKNGADIKDLDLLVNMYRVPVAVNWQCLFYDSLEEEKREDPKGDHGHYSIVVGINPNKDKIVIADPYPDFAPKTRTFSLQWFKTRWWDAARDVHQKTKQVSLLRTRRFLFVLAPETATFPHDLHLKPPAALSQLEVPTGSLFALSNTFPYHKSR
jgi:ABC-type bacteriocin/lantibiotic exporter with double-glycine peptidase domain